MSRTVNINSRTLLALSSKAVEVFEEKDTFFSVCLSPITFSPEALLLAVGRPEFSRETMIAQADFSMLVNSIPTGRLWNPTGEYLWSLCEDLFKPGMVEVSVGRALTEEELATKRTAENILCGENWQPSPIQQRYWEYEGRYITCNQSLKGLRSEVERVIATGTPRIVAERWEDEEKLRREADKNEAWNAWITLGFKREVESAEETKKRFDEWAPTDAWCKWEASFQLKSDYRDGRQIKWAPSFLTPLTFLEEGTWLQMSLDSQEVERLCASAAEDLQNRLVVSSDQALSFEFKSVRIVRPWFEAKLLRSRTWRFVLGERMLCDGMDPPSGELPGYSAAVILIRNIELTAGDRRGLTVGPLKAEAEREMQRTNLRQWLQKHGVTSLEIVLARNVIPSLIWALQDREFIEAYDKVGYMRDWFRKVHFSESFISSISDDMLQEMKHRITSSTLAYYVAWHMRRKLAPLLFGDHDRPAAAATRTSPVAVAQISPAARAKARARKTDDGSPVHSFRTLLADLATLTRNTVRFGDNLPITVLSRPTPVQRYGWCARGLAPMRLSLRSRGGRQSVDRPSPPRAFSLFDERRRRQPPSPGSREGRVMLTSWNGDACNRGAVVAPGNLGGQDPDYATNVAGLRVTSMEESHTHHTSDNEFATLFYKHQYERMYALEQQTINITSVVITLLILALSFGFDKYRASPYTGFVLLVSIIIINVFAILYILRSAQAIDVHRGRALQILQRASPHIYEIHSSTEDPPDIWTQTGLYKLLNVKTRGRLSIQIAIHCILIFMMFVFLIFWFHLSKL